MKKEFKIDGMSCAHCKMAIEKTLSKLDLKKILVKIGSAEVEFDSSKVNEKEIADAITKAGYKVIN
jgi:copper chaperone CopZ